MIASIDTPMNKTREIKKIIGSVIKDAGFKYLYLDKGIVWIFSREINDVEEHVLIQQHTKYQKEYKLMFSTTAILLLLYCVRVM